VPLSWFSAGNGRRPLGLLSQRELIRSIWLGVAIGIVSGLGAIAFAWSIEFLTDHLLGALAGYHPAQPAGEGDRVAASGPDRPWALPLVLGLGGLISGLLVFTLAPEAEGHGTDAAIEAFHRKAGRTRLRVIPVKLLASAITIGSGGAAGREGPTAQIGGGFGSFISDVFRLGATERRRALAAGVGAGIGAIFRAPLGGALMGAEVLYRHDLEAEVILLGLISSIVGYSVYGTWAGWDPIFGGGAGFSFSHPSELGYYALLGLACGVFGILYARVFYGLTAGFRQLPVPRTLKPAIGGLAVGTIGMAAPESIHVGYGTVQQLLTPQGIETFSIGLLLALPFLRIITTSLTVGSGGSGGIFGPGMVIGAVVGAAAWKLFHGLPGFPTQPGPVVIVGMIAAFGSIAHAPLAMLLMVGEMTGNLSLLAPAMVAVAIATLVVGDETIYKNQVDSRADSPAHRHRFALPLLSALPAGRAAVPVTLWHADTPVADVLREAKNWPALVVEPGGRLLGEVTRDRASKAEAEDGASGVGDVVTTAPSISSETRLDDALDRLASTERRSLPVVDPATGAPVGVIDAGALVRSYREASRAGVRQVASGRDSIEAIQVTLEPTSRLAGRPLRESHLPHGARVVVIERDGDAIVPDGDTVVRPGDVLTLWCSSNRIQALKWLIGS
jgi:chloride channel protein, CIC family